MEHTCREDASVENLVKSTVNEVSHFNNFLESISENIRGTF